MKALVIGGKGQLGTTLTRSAPDAIKCVSLDLPEFDITDAQQVESVVKEQKPDVIINTSAFTAVDRAEEEVELAYAVNAKGPGNLALAAKRTSSRLIHVSTDYVFDGIACTPYKPDAPCNPLGVYGKSKRAGEINILSLLDKAIILRTSWLYSQYGNNFVLTMLKLMQKKDQLKVIVDQIGSPTWASTLSKAIWSVAEKPQIAGIYHWADAGMTSWYDFAVAIQKEAYERGLLHRLISIEPIRTDQYATLAERPFYSVLDCSTSWNDIAVTPMHWRAGLRQMLVSLMHNTEKEINSSGETPGNEMVATSV